MSCPVRQVHLGELAFDIYENVYEPAEDSFLFAENLKVRVGDNVLDLGTGCGVLAALAVQHGAHVLAIDINPFAVRCTKHNLTLNCLKSIALLQADLLSALSSTAKFDLILFNAPYLPSEKGEEATWIGRSWAGGVGGRQVVDKFISQVRAHLKLDGRVNLMQSTLAGVEQTIAAFSQQNMHARVVAECKLPFFETLTFIEAKS